MAPIKAVPPEQIQQFLKGSPSYRPAVESPKGRPSVLLRGVSGAGKTTAIGHLCMGGLRVAVVDLEGRTETIERYRPLIIPVRSLKALDTVNAIMADPDVRSEFIKDKTDGEWDDIDIIAYDGLMEIGAILDRTMAQKYGKTGYTRWEELGLELVGYCDVMRSLSSSTQKKPLGVIATLGEAEMDDGSDEMKIVVRGRYAIPRIPFYFTYVFRLSPSIDERGEARWTLISVGKNLKGPGSDFLPPVVDITGTDGFYKVWQRLEKHMRFIPKKEEMK